MKNVANELEGSSAHEARRINAKGNVVNGLSAMNSFGNHELFVLGPGKLGRSFGGAGAGIACRLRSLEQTSEDRKSTRLNSSHGYISYAVFCLKKKNSTRRSPIYRFFFFNDTATTEIYTLSLHDALPISSMRRAML